MKMWAKIRKPNTKKKNVPPIVFSLPKEVHILPSRRKSKKPRKFRPPPSSAAMDARKEHPEIVVPAISFSKGLPIADENQFPNHPTWESIESTGKISKEGDEQLSVLTNENYRLSESRQDSVSNPRSFIVSNEVSFLEERHQPREAPPEAARSKILTHNRAFRHKQAKNHPRKFTLRPKSIVRKWNRYADLEEKGLSASPRLKTKLAKSLHLELASASLDSNENVAPVDSIPVTEKEEDKLAVIQKSCSDRVLQDGKGENETVVATESSPLPVGEGNLTLSSESCANRCVQVDTSEVKTEESSVSSRKAKSDASASMIHTGDIQRITENGFPASVLDENEPIQDPSEGEPTTATKLTICTTNESESSSVSSISDYESESSNQNMQADTPNEHSRQKEIVTLSLAQILVQSYQPDPNNPGYWKKKGADDETNSKRPAPKSYLRKDSPLPSLNTFLNEVKARRNEIMIKSNETEKDKDDQPAPIVKWYGVKREGKQAKRRASHPGKQTNASPKDLFVELKAKQRAIGSKAISKPNQKRIVVCKPSSGTANDLLSELKAKQQERKLRAMSPKKEANIDETGTGFLPDLMTELKAKQREIKSRPSSPAKRVDPSASKTSKGLNPSVVSGLKAKQRAIEDRFYARLANLQSSLRRKEQE